MIRNRFKRHGFAWLGLSMALVTLVFAGFVAFRFVQQDNTQIATIPTTTQHQPSAEQSPEPVAHIQSTKDVETVETNLDHLNLDELDADLDSEFNF